MRSWHQPGPEQMTAGEGVIPVRFVQMGVVLSSLRVQRGTVT